MTDKEKIPLYGAMKTTLQEYRERRKSINMIPLWWRNPQNFIDLESVLKDLNKDQVRYSRDLIDLLATAPRKDDWDEIGRVWEQINQVELDINLMLEGMVIVE